MLKKTVLASFLVIVVAWAVPASVANAKPRGPEIDLHGLSYAQSTTQMVGGSNDGFMAEGQGTIDCNGVAACTQAGLDGGTVTFQQGFWVPEIEVDSTGVVAIRRARTAGWMHLPGEYPAVKFHGAGQGTAACSENVCHLNLTFHTSVQRGARLIFVLQIDYTSDGFAETFDGVATLIGDPK